MVRKEKKSHGRRGRGSKPRGYSRKVAIVKNPVNLVGFPLQRIVKMRYIEQITLSLSGTYETSLYRANSIFDPRYATGGHQPLGHDQWSTFYDHYVVLGSKLTFTLSADSSITTPKLPVIVAAYTTDDATLVNPDPMALAEQGKCRYKMMNGNNGTGTFAVSSYYSAKKFYNVTDVNDNLDRIGASFGADPPDIALFAVSAGLVNGGSISQNLYGIIQIDYIVSVSEPKDLSQS